MLIGINATAAFIKPRTGVEEYTYQLIKHLAMLEESRQHRFILYAPAHLAGHKHIMPDHLRVKRLKWPYPMWTQIRLSWELILSKPEILLIPVHVLPFTHPKKTVVTVHGLEYEHYPQYYSWRQRIYLRWITKRAVLNASKIITVSENTKQDLIKLYQVAPHKITTIYHGMPKIKIIKNQNHLLNHQTPYILYLGRIETKKNVQGLIRAFNLFKKNYQSPHQLVLLGPKGFGYEEIKILCLQSRYRDQIIEKGYLDEKSKWTILRKASLLALPSFYEGFGMPILEAQACGVPVLTSDVSAMPEVAGQGAFLVHPNNIEDMAFGLNQALNQENTRKHLIRQGFDNLKRFDWLKTARQTLKVLIEP